MTEIPFTSLPGQNLGFALEGENLIEMDQLTVREGQKSYVPQPPVVTLITPAGEDITVDAKSIQFKAGIKSDSKLTGVKLLVNDTQVQLQAKRDAEGKYDVLVDQEVPLNPGYNDIRLMAKNEDGLIQRFGIRVATKSGDQVVRRQGTDYALFIATDEYAQWSDLVNPVNDCRTIAQELETNYGFNTELVISISRGRTCSRSSRNTPARPIPTTTNCSSSSLGTAIRRVVWRGLRVCTDSEKDDEGNDTYIAHSNLRTIVNAIPLQAYLPHDGRMPGGTIDPFIASGGGHRGGDESLGGGKEVTQTDFINRKLAFKTRRYPRAAARNGPGRHPRQPQPLRPQIPRRPAQLRRP
ncbi:MAG: hypothetical protein U0176_05445 [Bacteroidia bacterium]